MVSSQLHYTKVNRFMPFLLAEILNFQGSTHRIGVGSFSYMKYLVLLLIVLLCYSGVYGKAQGTSPWDVFSMLTAGRLPNSKYLVGIVLLVLIIVGMCTQERFFCQFLCPMGAVFALMPILPGALFRRNREKCPPKCGLCKKRCPAHLDIDGDTGRSGECLCCHACAAACPRKNIHIGTIEEK
mgnify:CR=1 FL=1